MLSNNLHSVFQPQVLHVPPETLFDHLTGKVLHLNQLMETLDANPYDLAATLASPDFDLRVKVQVDLAIAQAKLIAAAALPDLTLQLIAMAKDPTTGKETARRCIATVMHMGGLSTSPPKPDPKPQPRAYDPDKTTSDEQTAIDNLMALEKDFGIDLARLTKDQRPAFVNHIHKFLQPQGYIQAQQELKRNAQSQAAALQRHLAQHAPIDADATTSHDPTTIPEPRMAMRGQPADTTCDDSTNAPQVNPNPTKQALSSPPAPLDLPPETILPQLRDPDDPEDAPTHHPAIYAALH